MIKKSLSALLLVFLNSQKVLAETGIPKLELTISSGTKLAIIALAIALILILIYWILRNRITQKI